MIKSNYIKLYSIEMYVTIYKVAASVSPVPTYNCVAKATVSSCPKQFSKQLVRSLHKTVEAATLKL